MTSIFANLGYPQFRTKTASFDVLSKSSYMKTPKTHATYHPARLTWSQHYLDATPYYTIPLGHLTQIAIMERSQSTKPARRKLQKSDPKLKGLKAKRGSSDSTLPKNFTNNYNVGLQSPTSPRQMGSFGSSSKPSPPDLSDSKWNQYVENRPLASPASQLEPQFKAFREPRKRPLPEFSRLQINDATTRPSLDNTSMPSPASSTSTSSTMRRQAKTPVFRIGQLENPVTPREIPARETEVPEKTSSVDLIAEQYRALLETQDHSDVEDGWSDRRPSHENPRVPQTYIPRKISESSQSRTHLEPPRLTNHGKNLPRRPPTPDDEGLVAFEEDAIYFKPVSFSPEPSPRHSLLNEPLPQYTPDNLSLQICLDLLTRELSSALVARPNRTGSEATTLQIWVMIEAYERLQDQLSRLGLENEELKQVEHMLNTWLRALYSLHNSMTGEGRRPHSESEYGDLEEDVD